MTVGDPHPFLNALGEGLRIFVDCHRRLATASSTGLATQCFPPALERVVDAPRRENSLAARGPPFWRTQTNR